MPDGNEPITDDEFVFRRIPASMNWYNREVSEFSSPQAFTPITHDRDGLSLVRAKYMSAEECGATGMEGRQFYVAIFSVRVLREHNIIVEPDPQECNPGHYTREVSTFSSPQAFPPITHDRDALSLVRAKYMSAER